MFRCKVKWMVSALAVLALMGICVTVGMTLLPPGAEAEARGTLIPWLVTWGMIWATVAMGVVLAGYMVVLGLGQTAA